MKEYRTIIKSPLGLIEITASDQGIVSVLFENKIEKSLSPTPDELQPQHLKEAKEQLLCWFQGKLLHFDLPIHVQGTLFQQQVWKALVLIPYGQTFTYARVAAEIGKPEAIRAVGAAIGQNRLNIIIPCHRVVGARGQLTGYGGEIWRKAWLLNFEQETLGFRFKFDD
ncbi:MAG: methylated-DNA-[protein]-cysteine S-methyltransferase [Bacteroidales bacterium]|jgi:methylated-DNA-[protein]-cysteine S-methyltransferase|nr:methylated-DNA-[protein]-cysteine S-methyltransferase [Bacteroidales bacterium]MDN5328826.1 methylated-DNA-[protein]-cysteine S-methyltransferase [Bacteroidales bacterium]